MIINRHEAVDTFMSWSLWVTEFGSGGFRTRFSLCGAVKSDQEGNNLMFLTEWREFPSAPCFAGEKKFDDSPRLDIVEIARVHDILPGLFPS